MTEVFYTADWYADAARYCASITILYNANDYTFFFVNLCAFVVLKELTTKTQRAQRRHEEEKVNYCRAAAYYARIPLRRFNRSTPRLLGHRFGAAMIHFHFHYGENNLISDMNQMAERYRKSRRYP